MKELFIRFVVGGTVVSFFAVLGDLLKPKSFAGLLGARTSCRPLPLQLRRSSYGWLLPSGFGCAAL